MNFANILIKNMNGVINKFFYQKCQEKTQVYLFF